MTSIWRCVWHCDDCGHEWLKTDGVTPRQCPKRGCRSRNWNRIDAAAIIATIPNVTTAAQLAPSSLPHPIAHHIRCQCATCKGGLPSRSDSAGPSLKDSRPGRRPSGPATIHAPVSKTRSPKTQSPPATSSPAPDTVHMNVGSLQKKVKKSGKNIKKLGAK